VARGNAAAAGDFRLGQAGFLQRFAEGLGEEVEQRDKLRFLFHAGGSVNIEHRSARKRDSVFAGESEDFDAGNGVEVWVAMHQDETRRIRDSGDERIGQG
jgi:hypothetical protein